MLEACFCWIREKGNQGILDVYRIFKYGRIADIDGRMAYGIEYDGSIQQSKLAAGPQEKSLSP
jgi:hypothetical protein